MKYEKSLVFICLLICLFSIATVTASDVNETVVAIDNQSEILDVENNEIKDIESVEEDNSVIKSVNENNYLVATSDGTFTDLANDIANANGELNLSRDYVYDSSKDSRYKDGIIIDKKIIINGKGFNVDGNLIARAFYISANNVTLKNINFNKCVNEVSKSANSDGNPKPNSQISESKGGAIYWEGHNGNILYCNFNSCHIDSYTNYYNAHSYSFDSYSYSYGGAIYWTGNKGSITNCNFNSCYSSSRSVGSTLGTNSGYVYSNSYSYGGAVYWQGTNGNINDCSFQSCYSSSSGSITNSHTELNTYGFGGAVYWNGEEGNINKSKFTSCKSSNSGTKSGSGSKYDGSAYGGAINWKGIKGNIIDCSFIKCSSSGASSNAYSGSAYGGALYWGGTNGGLFNSSFKECSCSVSTAHGTTKGFAIHWEGSSGIMFNSSFNGNYYNYESYCSGATKPLLLIYVPTINDDECGVTFDSTQLIKNITVSLYNVTGNINLYKQFTISSDELTSSLNLNNLEEGEYQIVLDYEGDNFYSSTSIKELYRIGKNSSFEVKLNEKIIEGDQTTINLTLNDDATGRVKITLNNYTCINELVNGKTSFNIPYVMGGVNSYHIKYEGDVRYNPIFINNTFNALHKSDVILNLKKSNIFDEKILLNYTITPNCKGIISIFVDDVFKTNISVGDTFELENIAVGNHNVTVIYNGDENFSTSKDTAAFTVSKADPSIMINSTNLAGDVIFEVNLTEMATGNVTISLNNNLYSERIKNGKTVIVIPNLGAGDYDCVISYEGDSNYNPSTQNYNFKLQLKKSNITINVGDITLGDVLDVKFNLTEGTTGTIGVYINDDLVQTIEVNDEISIPDLTVGNYSVKLVYNGDEFYETSQDILTFNVLKIKPTIEIISVTSNSGDITFGDIVVVNYQITDGVTGTIGVYIDSILNKTVYVGDSLSVADLNAGTHTIKLVYNGDENYGISENNVTFEVLKQEIDISNAATIVDAVYGKTKIVFNCPFEGDLNIVLSNGYQKSFNILSNENNNLDLSDANAGDYEITYNFVPSNKNYQDATYTDSLKILKTLPKFNIDVKDINYNQNFKAEITFLSDITGTMNITLKNEDDDEIDKKINLNMANGVLKYEINKLDASRYYLTFSYSGNDNYYSYNEEVSFQVFKIDPIMYFDITNATYGQTARIVVNSAVDGNVTFKIGSISYDEILIENNLIIQEIKNIDAGNYTVKIIYNGNNNYNAKTYEAKLTINKLPTTVIGTADDITYSDSAIINVKASMDGNVIVAIDENYIDNINVLSNTVTPITFANIPAGKHNVSITFKPTNKNYDESSFNTDFTVSKKQTSVSLDVVDSVYGEDVIVGVTASEDGSVVLTVGDITRERTVLANTMVKFNLGVLAADSYEVSVSFNGGFNYKTSNNEDSFVVSPAEAEIVSVQAQDNVYDENTVVKVKTNVDGILTVKFYNEMEVVLNTTLNVVSNELTSLEFGGFNVGTYIVTVSLDAGSNYTKPINTTKVNVSPKSTIVDLIVDDSVYGEDVVVNVTASEDGKVTIKMGDVNKTVNVNSNEVVSVNLDIFDVGSYAINVTFDAGKNYVPSFKNDSIVISKADALITDVQVGNSVYGDNVIVKVKTNVDGDLTVKIGEKTNSINIKANNLTSFDFGVLDVGTYSVTVSLDAGNNYNNPINITKVTVSPKTTYVYLVVEEEYDAAKNITVNVYASEDGNVTIMMGEFNKIIEVKSNQPVSVVMGTVSRGMYNIDVNFTAGTNYCKSHNSTIVKVLSKIDEGNLDISIPEIVANQENKIVINLPGDATGNVTLTIANNTYSFNVENGVATVNVPKLDDGSYDYIISYSGDNNYSSFSTSGSIDVSKPTPEVVIPPLDKPSADGSITLNLPSGATGTVTLVINKKPYSFPVNNGVAKIYMPDLTNGNYEYVITYSGDGKYSSFTKTGKVTINKPAPKPAKETTLTLKKVKVKRSAKKLVITATLKVNGKAVKGKTIKFKFNKKTYKAKTNKKGIAKITVKKSVLKKLKAGKKVKYQATYGKITKKVTVKVKK